MKVFLKVTVLDHIIAEFSKAARDNREVDAVAVTPAEYSELCGDRRIYGYMSRPLDLWTKAPAAAVEMTMQTRDFALLDIYRGVRGCSPYIRCASHEQIMGKPLFVVPAEYCPK